MSRPPREPYDRGDGVTVIEDPRVAEFGTDRPRGYDVVRIIVYGQPAPQGSKRPRAKITASGAVKTWTQEQNKVPVDQWRSDVKSEGINTVSYMAAPESAGGLAMDGPFAGPVGVRMVFSFTRPATHYRTGRNAAILKATAPIRPVTKAGDLDKLARSTCDALTAAGIWKDDKQVAEFTRLAKVWCGEDKDALNLPGAVITIWPLPA